MLQQLADEVKNSDMTPITYEGDIMFG
jgi:hypothetical protein